MGCLFLLLPCPAFAVPPQKFVIQEPAARIEDDTLMVMLSVTVDNEDGLRDMLKDGAILALTVATEVERVRSWWTNEGLLSSEFVSTIYHDPLTRDFMVLIPGADGKKLSRDKNLTRLLHSTWRLLTVPVTPLQVLRAEDPQGEYRIALNISLQHTEIPPWLEQSLVFWTSDVVPREKFVLPFRLDAAK